MVEEESEGVKEEELDVGVGARHLVPPQQHAEQHIQRDHVHNLVLSSILSLVFPFPFPFFHRCSHSSLPSPFSLLLFFFWIQEE